MANHKSAKKRAKQSKDTNLRNRSYLSKVKTAIKGFVKSLEDSKAKENAEDIQKSFSSVQSVIQKAAGKGIFHRNKASRKISRLEKSMQKAIA